MRWRARRSKCGGGSSTEVDKVSPTWTEMHNAAPCQAGLGFGSGSHQHANPVVHRAAFWNAACANQPGEKNDRQDLDVRCRVPACRRPRGASASHPPARARDVDRARVRAIARRSGEAAERWRACKRVGRAGLGKGPGVLRFDSWTHPPRVRTLIRPSGTFSHGEKGKGSAAMTAMSVRLRRAANQPAAIP